MLTARTGDIFNDDAEAIVNPVNVVGHMGKGLAAAFRARYPDNYAFYRAAVEAGDVEVGRVLVFERPRDEQLSLGPPRLPRLIVNFPTKRHWRGSSRIEFIDAGLSNLRDVVKERKVRSIAVPALGCGLGGLEWEAVRPLIQKYLGDLDADVRVYAP